MVSLPGILLACVVALAAVLTYQAQDAARSQRVTAENALRDYSAFATNQLARELRIHSQSLLRLSFSRVLTRVENRMTGRATAAEVARDVNWQRVNRIETSWCECLDSVSYYFALNLASGRLDVAVGGADSATAGAESGALIPSPVVRGWVRDTLLATLASLASGEPQVTVTADATISRARPFDLAITNDSYGFLLGESEGEDRLLAYVVARDADGAPLAVYGYEAAPGSWLRPLLELIIEEEDLLPPSLLRGRPNAAVLQVVVSDHLGHELYRSADGEMNSFAAREVLPIRFGMLEVNLSLYPNIAEQLVVGGLPSSRLPLLVALFLLTAGLAVVALMQIRHQQELARMRGDFVASVSHELRTPLAQIRWFAELLRMGRLRSPEERERSLRVIDQEARRLAFLVENVLNFSHSGSRAARVRPERVALASEVREIVEGFAPLVASRNVTIRLELEEGVPAMVDRAALRQIVLNLLDNAAKYGPPGQTVVVGVSRAKGGRVRLWVQDEGPGIPEAERESVWTAFYRAERDRGSVATGSGIGLAVVGDLVSAQNGRRWIETPTGGGTRMVLEFPSGSNREAIPEMDDLAQSGAVGPGASDVARREPRGERARDSLEGGDEGDAGAPSTFGPRKADRHVPPGVVTTFQRRTE